MDTLQLFNISSPEEIKFKFSGKLGRYSTIWQRGQWIITTTRIIFIADAFNSNQGIFFGTSLAFIILLKEITDVIKKKFKIIIKYSTSNNEFHVQYEKKFKIGFYEADFRDFKVDERPELIDSICDFLTHVEKEKSHSYCPNCETNLDMNEKICPNCGASFTLCELCKYQILDLTKQIECPSCQTYYHKKEFLEWMKIHGRCPSCNIKINRNSIL